MDAPDTGSRGTARKAVLSGFRAAGRARRGPGSRATGLPWQGLDSPRRASIADLQDLMRLRRGHGSDPLLVIAQFEEAAPLRYGDHERHALRGVRVDRRRVL